MTARCLMVLGITSGAESLLARTPDTVFDGLADCLERNSTPGFLQALIAD